MYRSSERRSSSAREFRNGRRKMRRENMMVMRGGWRL